MYMCRALFHENQILHCCILLSLALANIKSLVSTRNKRAGEIQHACKKTSDQRHKSEISYFHSFVTTRWKEMLKECVLKEMDLEFLFKRILGALSSNVCWQLSQSFGRTPTKVGSHSLWATGGGEGFGNMSQNVRNGLEHTFPASHLDIIPEHSHRWF